MYTHGMKAVIRMWGNSLAIRIPKNLAADAGIKEGTEVELSAKDGRLHVAPVLSLETLLEQITPENLHTEIRDIWNDPPVGKELW